MKIEATLTTAQLAALRSRAQKLDAVLKVGKQGLTPAFLATVELALDQHELIKVKFADHKKEKKDLAPRLAEGTRSLLVTLIGNVAVLYRQQSDPARRKIAI